MVSRKLASILTAILVSLSTCAVAADNTARAIISGTVVDVRGGAVGRAKITAINDARGLQRQTVTNDEGYFEIPFLPAGVYTLTVEMSGFATIRVTQLEAQSSVNRRLMIVLEPRGRAETITVKASSVTVEASDATLEYSITREQTETFPIISTSEGRAILESLPLIVPGVTPLLLTGKLGEGLSINGARPLANVFTLNGGDHNDTESSLAVSAFPNPEALQEVSIVTNNYKADLGGGTGGIINVVTRSGGNAVHGGVRYIVNNEAFNARDFFNKIKPRNRLNMIGGQFEGPVYLPGLYNGRDRTHFFFDLERRLTADESGFLVFSSRDIPRTLPAKERSGDFSDYPLPDPNNPSAPHRPIDPLTGQPFPGGIIPANRIDPIARYYLDRFIPTSDRDDGLLDLINRSDSAYTQATLRADHRFNNSDLLSATYFLNNSVSNSSDLFLPQGERKNANRDQSLVLNYTHIFSSRTANQMTAALNRSIQFVRVIKPGFTDLHPREAGFTGIKLQDENLTGLPHVFVGSLQYRRVGDVVSIRPVGASVGYGAFPNEGFKTTLSVRDDFSLNRGIHTFGFGGGARFFFFDKYAAAINGSFTFGDSDFQGTGTGNGIADFLLGLPARYSQSTGSIQRQRDRALFVYAMDDWKARPNLTINIGLRYELDAPTTDERDGVIVF
ncbi:MAG: TonB-dependent receptor, partial [Acidobacteriota bacterium]